MTSPKPPAPSSSSETSTTALTHQNSTSAKDREPKIKPNTAWLIGRGRLAQSLKLEEQGPERLARYTGMTIAGMSVVFLLWATFTPITETATASGEVHPVGSIKRLQHLEGGIIAEILVSEGDLVEADQRLMRLDPGSALPQRDQLKARLAALELQARQLTALVAEENFSLSEADSGIIDLAEAQLQLLITKRNAAHHKAETLRQQIRQTMADFDLFKNQEESLLKEIGFLRETVDMREGLARKGLTKRVLLLENKQELAQAETRLAEILGNQARSLETIGEIESRLKELEAATKLEAAQEQALIAAEIAELKEALTQAEDRVRRLEIQAPLRGVVQDLQIETVGGVIAPGAKLMDIIPLDVEMVVEARISTKDIGHITIGQEAEIKVMTYDYTRYGSLSGHIDRLSATTFEDEHGDPFYRARIRLDQAHLGDDPDKNRIMPGMTVIADVKTGEKSLIAYLLKPIYASLGNAFHER